MNVAFIPVRGGSKSIPLKNIKPMAGKPLVYWTAKAACDCKYIDKVYISTDCDKIKETVQSFISKSNVFRKLEVIGRSVESASDTASTEFVMLEFAQFYEFDNIALVQATSPLLLGKDLDEGFKTLSLPNTDSVMSVVHQFRFNWDYDEMGYIHPTNYDVFNRPRRQEFNGNLVENGAFYITSKECLLNTKNRVSGKIKAVEMDPDTFFEIDEPSDWQIIESLMHKKVEKNKNHFSIPTIKMLLTDVDGCLTDGGMYYSEHGDELKKFNTRDGMGFSILKKKGILTGIVTSEKVKLNCYRAEKLKLDIIEMDCKNKASTIKNVAKEFGVDLSDIAYVGDDINDLEALKIVGFACCPSDAISTVKDVVDYVAKKKGGEGVIREIQILISEDDGFGKK